jgi:hypothetical protein
MPRDWLVIQTQGRSILSDQDVATAIELIKDCDSVEFKLTVPEPQHQSTIMSLGLDPLIAQIRQVFFFDTPDLALDRHGIIVRARRIQGKGTDFTVKLRPVLPTNLPVKLRKSTDFTVELDALPGGFVCSGSLKAILELDEVTSVAAGELPLDRLFTKQQRRLFEEHAPEGVGLVNLSALGPILVLRSKLKPKAFGRGLVAEMWFYPDNSRVLELSTRCVPAEAFQAAAEARAFLTSSGVDLTGEQQTKTNKALNFFAKSLGSSATSY